MKKEDLLVFIMIALCLILPLREGTPVASVILLRIVFIVLFGTLVALAAKWPKRLKDDKKRRRLLSLPVQKTIGVCNTPTPYFDGKVRYEYVPSGFSQQIGGNWNLYNHYHLEQVRDMKGWHAVVVVPDSGQTIEIHTLPDPFWGKAETIPSLPQPKAITYVTDSDGTNYFVSV